jgi:phosphoserine phosphatase
VGAAAKRALLEEERASWDGADGGAGDGDGANDIPMIEAWRAGGCVSRKAEVPRRTRARGIELGI